MYKKLISSILVVALLNLVGCYSFESVTVPEYKQVEEKEGKPSEIYVKTKDSQEYHFSDSNFHIDSDTLYWKEKMFLSKEEKPFEEKFALGEIKSFQLEKVIDNYSVMNTITVSEYQNIEAERGKPDEIYLTKYDESKYHFMKTDFYIENDTLYGKGKLLVGAREEFVGRTIALSNIESIEVETFNLGNTILLSTGILLGVLIIASIIIVDNWKGPK